MRRRRARYGARPRDLIAAHTLRRANGECDRCGVRHGNRHGPLIACVNGIALCRNCQRESGIAPLVPPEKAQAA